MSDFNVQGDRKVCILINSLTIGGAERLALALFEKFKKRGMAVVFLCLEKNNFYQLNDSQINYLSTQTGENEGFIQKFFYLFIFAFRLKRFVRTSNIAVVSSHIYRANYVNLLAKLMGSGHKAQLVNHGIVSRYEQQGVAGKVNLFLIKRLYPRADQIIFPSSGMMQELKDIGKFENDLAVIANPFDVAGILDKKDEPVEPAHFVFKSDKTYLVAAGRLEKVKRYDDILYALNELKKRGMDLDFILLGDGPEKMTLQKLARDLGLNDRVHLLGSVTNPFPYVSWADIFVSSSEFEGFSNVIVEAMICGTPVISTDCPSGPREILAPDTKGEKHLETGKIEFAQYGVLVPVQDPQTLAEAVRALLEDPRRRAQYAEKGILRAREFDISVIAEKYIQKISALMD